MEEFLVLCGSTESVLARDLFLELIQEDSLFHVDAFYQIYAHLIC